MRRQVTAKVHAPDGSLTVSEMDRREAVWRDLQPMVSRCAVDGCEWIFSGTAGDARTASADHRSAEHPPVRRRK